MVRVVITDSNVLINLMHVDRLDLLGRIPGHEFVVPDEVREELTEADLRAMIDDMAARGTLKLQSITDLDARSIFVASRRSRSDRRAQWEEAHGRIVNCAREDGPR
jgi:predicted nucleic acid-binding protein